MNAARRRPAARAKEREAHRAAYAPIKAANAAAREERRARLAAARAAIKATERAKREEQRLARLSEIQQRKREQKRKARKEYYQRNPAKKKVLKARRRAKERNATVPLTAAERRRLEAIYADARRRTAETGGQWDVHHIVPLSKGGLHQPSNLEVIPARLNNAIGDKPLSALEYIMS
jgi:5-methylcytosine-specific restriction endonuclease McrA